MNTYRVTMYFVYTTEIDNDNEDDALSNARDELSGSNRPTETGYEVELIREDD